MFKLVKVYISKMESSNEVDNNYEDESDLDPRIRIELEQLNNATDEINKLEMLFVEANTTFRILMNDSTKRLKACARKIGSSIERARPYYDALDISKKAQQECQIAAVKFQRANEIHKAAKETVALAETRYLSHQHEWKFDNAWQEMLNHATIKVTEAENQKSESGREHQKRAMLFNAAEQKVQILEQKLKRSILKSRPYFDEKALCQSKLDAQKAYINELSDSIAKAKAKYSNSLRRLEQISEEIHYRRRDKSGSASPRGPREPGVGAELTEAPPIEEARPPFHQSLGDSCSTSATTSYDMIVKRTEQNQEPCASCFSSNGAGDHLSCRDRLVTAGSSDCDLDLDSCDIRSVGSASRATSSVMSEEGDLDDVLFEEELDELRQRVKELAVGGISKQSNDWETELKDTINKLDNALLKKECEEGLNELISYSSSSNTVCASCNTKDVQNTTSTDENCD